MATFSIALITAPVIAGDWSALRRLRSRIRGSVLEEHDAAPMLASSIDAESPLAAAVLIDGLCAREGIDVVCGQVFGDSDFPDFALDAAEMEHRYGPVVTWRQAPAHSTDNA